MKKILGLTILLLALYLCLCYASADLNSQRTFGLFTYTLKGNGTATITDFDWETNGTEDIYLPSMIDGYVVNAIGDEAFADDFFISEYTYAYYKLEDSSKSTKVYLPDSITSIGEKAFWGSNIKMINIPAATTKIGDGAFGCCFALDRINITGGNAKYATIDGALYDKTHKKLIFWPLYSSLDVKIPEGIKSIGKYVFYNPDYDNSYNFKYHTNDGAPKINITLPSTLIEIDDYAFTNAGVSLDIKSTVIDRIGKYAFSDSTLYGSSKFQTVKVCDEYSFSYAHSSNDGLYRTADVTFSEIVSVEKYAFYGSGYKKVVDIDILSVNHIAEYAFAKNTYIKLNMEHCSEVGQHSFEASNVHCFTDYMNKIPIDFTINVSSIPDSIYNGSQLCCWTTGYDNPRVIIGEDVKRIESKAFLDCSQDEYEIPEGVEYIALDAFDITKDVLTVVPDSYGESWAIENGISYKYADGDDLSWLN